jgi:hypothetical protein
MWSKDSSQHEKCQVGNMHPNSLDLVLFFIIRWVFDHHGMVMNPDVTVIMT